MAQSNDDRQKIARILDATANRASEGLRVLEDYVRFGINSQYLTRELKTMRHDLVAIIAQLKPGELLSARDIVGDVGSEITTQSEQMRENLRDVVKANIKRLEQSLRSLEEYAKFSSSMLGAACERLRYRTYQIEQHLFNDRERHERLEAARLYLLLDGRSSLEEFRIVATQFVEAGADVIQLRDKQLTDRELIARGQLLHEIIHSANASQQKDSHRPLFIMNDRVDLAVICEADGVHVGQDELSVSQVRQILGPAFLVGVSTHNFDQARQAFRDNADYIGVGPIFPSQTKDFSSFPGLDILKEIEVEKSRPAFAIGGVTLENVGLIRATGHNRVAVGNAVLGSSDIRDIISKFKKELQNRIE
jgi:thiamine-phosphate pyrophosphorylase